MILCCGEALVDMLPRHLEGGDEAYLPVAGGAVFNTAIALGRLGEEVGFSSGVSTDMFGRQLIAGREASGVRTAFCVRSSGPTTLAFVKLEDGIARYSFFDENTAGRMLGEETIPDLPDSVQALHFGAISLIAEPCGSTFEAFMGRMCDRVVISLDPNIRPNFVTDEASYRERLRRMIAMSDIIKVSEEDLAWMEPGAQFERVAENWIAGGASVITLTMGEGGARAITPSADITVPAELVDVVDTVGAGDSFNAGLLASFRASAVLSKPMLGKIETETLRSAVAAGSRIAAFSVGRAGADPPWRRDLQMRESAGK